MNDSVRKALPALITFVALMVAFLAVVLMLHGDLTAGGACILVCYLLDALDGEVARRLGVASDFGLQLDSLVDAVAFGVAPGLLVYQHLLGTAFSPAVTYCVCAAYLVGGVFRLARFNLLPRKRSYGDSVGLTISTSGATVALGVLADLSYAGRLIPVGVFPALMLTLTFLMVSRIRYPALAAILRRRWLSLGGLGIAALLAIWLSPPLVGSGILSGYVSFGIVRAAHDLVR